MTPAWLVGGTAWPGTRTRATAPSCPASGRATHARAAALRRPLPQASQSACQPARRYCLTVARLPWRQRRMGWTRRTRAWGQSSGACVWLGRAGSAKDSNLPGRSVVPPRRESARRGEEKPLAPLCPQRAPFRVWMWPWLRQEAAWPPRRRVPRGRVSGSAGRPREWLAPSPAEVSFAAETAADPSPTPAGPTGTERRRCTWLESRETAESLCPLPSAASDLS